MFITIAKRSGSSTTRNLFSDVIYAGLSMGSLDILCAFLYFFLKSGKNPLFILKFIASGFIGLEALQGGTGILLAGLVFHYIIAFAFTLFFFYVYPVLPQFWIKSVITGAVYGLFVSLLMNLVVVPISSTPKSPLNPWSALINILIVIICIGIPLFYWARWRHNKNKRGIGFKGVVRFDN